MSRAFRNAKISPQPGVNPRPDNTPNNTPYWTNADKVRFYDNMLRKLGGWQGAQTNGDVPDGICRRIYSYFYSGKFRYLIGTHKKLYEYVQGTLTNITPLQTTATATLGTDPIGTTDTSDELVITDTTAGRANGDRIKLTAATTTNGVPDTDINKEHIIFGVVANTSFKIRVATPATSTGSGGGSSTQVFDEIADGFVDYELGFGWGGGLWQPAGAGLLWGQGTAFTNTYRRPRIWSFDRFGNDIVLTPGDGGKVYIYQNNNATAPTVLTNSPAQSNFVFVENNAVCSVYNNVFSASDLGNATVWSADETNLAYSDTIEGADVFWTSVPVREGRLLMSQTQVWLLRYVGQANGIWSAELKDATAGLLSPMSAVSLRGIAYWVGQYDFHIYDGGIIRSVPNTVKQYVGTSQSLSQYYKSFLWVSGAFNEMWLHFPSIYGVGEPDTYVIFNFLEEHFTPGTMDRTAAEYPTVSEFYPLLIDSDGGMWRHEVGYNDGNSAMSSYAETNWFQLGNGDETMRIMRITPDSTQVGDIDLTINTKLHQQDTNIRSFGPYAINTATQKVDTRAHGTLAQYRFEQNAMDEFFIMGGWYQGIQGSTPR